MQDLTSRYTQSAIVHEGKQWLIHHSATETPSVMLSPQQEIAILDQIDRYHRDVRKFETGIGYHVLVFPSGRSYRVSAEGTQRAHVAGLNHLYDGLCFVGTFLNGDRPSGTALAEARYVIAASGMKVAGGHKDVASTDCPGDWNYASLLMKPPEKLSPPMSVGDAASLFMFLTPGLPNRGVRVTPKPKRNNRRIYELEIP